jgi:RNA polymerase sigma-70 factor (ECF subfamily)
MSTGASVAKSQSTFGSLTSPAASEIQPSVRQSLDVLAARSKSTLRAELAEALEKTGRGDRAAFAKIYTMTARKLYGIVVRILGRRDLAEDVLQEVYLRVWQHAREFDRAAGSPITWLATIARNRALDEGKRKTTRSLNDFPEVLQLASADDPLADVELNEEHSRLLACLDELQPEKRHLILLAYYYGMTREEIAHHTGRPVATVKTWLRRSLAQLRERLDNDGK